MEGAGEEGGGAGRGAGRGAGTRAVHLDSQPMLQRLHARLGLPCVRLRVRKQLCHLRHVRPPGACPAARSGVPGMSAAARVDPRRAGLGLGLGLGSGSGLGSRIRARVRVRARVRLRLRARAPPGMRAAPAAHVMRSVVGRERLVRERRRLLRRLGVARLRGRAVGHAAAGGGGTQRLPA